MKLRETSLNKIDAIALLVLGGLFGAVWLYAGAEKTISALCVTLFIWLMTRRS